MNSTKLWMTDLTPSDFGMPTTGCAFGVATASRRAAVQGTTVSAAAPATATLVRERKAIATGIDGHMGLVQSYFPGTTAWRPPTC